MLAGSDELCPLFGGRLPVKILAGSIMPFLPYKCTFMKVAATCRGMAAAMSSDEAASLWGDITLTVCIDVGCPLCPYKRASPKDAICRILSKYPIGGLNMHCMVAELPQILSALSVQASIKSLTFTLTNQTDTPQLGTLLEKTPLNPHSFDRLKLLIIDSSHLTSVGLQGRTVILRALGHHLEALHLIGKSVSGIFQVIRDCCPLLRKLRVDRSESETDFSQYHSAEVREMVMHRIGFFPLCWKTNVPNLQRLELTFSCCHNVRQYDRFFGSLPTSVTIVDIEIPGADVNTIVSSIGKSVPHLRELRLRGSFASGIVGSKAISDLLSGCPELFRFEAGGSLSAFILILAPEAIPCLSIGKNLCQLTLRYVDEVVDALDKVLSEDSSLGGRLQEVTLWERRARLHPSKSWDSMNQKIVAIRGKYPSLKISLEDRI